MATNAADVLEQAVVHAHRLDEAIERLRRDLRAVGARAREWSPQVLDVRSAAAQRARRSAARSRSSSATRTAGLTNEEMFACQFLVHIPANPEFSSLNLAQAVQVVAYELRMAADAAMPFARGREAGHG